MPAQLTTEEWQKFKLLFTLFFNHRGFLWCNYHENLFFLIDYLFSEDQLIELRNKLVGFPNLPYADSCPGCGTYFGDTIGGRLRTGCSNCQSSCGSMGYLLMQIHTQTKLSNPWLEVICAEVIKESFAFGKMPKVDYRQKVGY